MEKVLLINMPFVSISRPAIGISILKAVLNQKGIACDVAYPSVKFAEWVGLETYEILDERVSDALFVGEWLFAQFLFGAQLDLVTYENTLQKYLSPEEFEKVINTKKIIGPFLDACITDLQIENYSIIGFTTTFEQNVASLALSKLIKQQFPEKAIVFGGANCEGEMGLELHRKFDWIDYVCTREGEICFPELVEHILNKQSPICIKGIIYRNDNESFDNGAAVPVENMDSIPIPDYQDYFNALRQTSFFKQLNPALLIETSRGCWWGVKSHCTFCGLNGANMNFRSKSAERVLEEIRFLQDRYQVRQFVAVDNIIDMRYFKDVLPSLAQKQLGVSLFYETKSNLSKEQVKLLHDSGINAIQPGVESLSTHVLQLMKKGVSAIQNIQLLKWCKEYNVTVAWNLLYGFPGETAEDYDEISNLIDSLYHLAPPHGVGIVRMDRFSPYYNESEKYGMVNVRPFAIYRYIYPLPEASLQKLVYFFEYDYANNQRPQQYIQKIKDKVEDWKKWSECDLKKAYAESPEMILTDSRPNRVHDNVGINGIQREVYDYCDQKRSFSTIVYFLKKKYLLPENFEEWLRNFLELMIGWRFMIRENDNYLSLAIFRL
jgi:ribosomal peptide maturation radical SAM protein 1